jgi:hypothetical protein
MAIVVNRAGFDLALKDERGNKISIPANNRAYNISDFVYFKYKELLHLLVPKNKPVVSNPINSSLGKAETINMNKAPDIIPPLSFTKIEEIKIDIEPEPIRENIKPLQGVKISKKKKSNFTRSGTKKTEEQKIDG